MSAGIRPSHPHKSLPASPCKCLRKEKDHATKYLPARSEHLDKEKGNHDTIGDQSDERAVQSLMFPPEWDRKSLWTWLLPPFNQSHIKRCEDDQTNLDQFKTFESRQDQSDRKIYDMNYLRGAEQCQTAME